MVATDDTDPSHVIHVIYVLLYRIIISLATRPGIFSALFSASFVDDVSTLVSS